MDVSLDGRPVRVGKIVCVGRNYAEHAAEMGADARLGLAPGGATSVAALRAEWAARPPFFFLKPSTALLRDGGEVQLPADAGAIEHEVELAVLIGARARRLAEEGAMAVVAGYAVLLDITAREMQAAAKKGGLPWCVPKGMDTFAPCGDFVAPRDRAQPDFEIELRVNGEVRQQGRTSSMIHPLARLLAHASRYMTLEPGDILATGTPAGVGPIGPGDVLEARVGDLPPLRVRAVALPP